MKRTYKINNISQIANDVKIAVASDFRFQNEKDFKRLCILFGKLFRANPDYIVLLGNLVEHANIKEKDLLILEKYLFELSKIAKVYSILDWHDQVSYVDGHYEPFINQELIDRLTKKITLISKDAITLKEGITLFSHLINLESRNKLSSDTYNILLENTTDVNVRKQLASEDKLEYLDLVLFHQKSRKHSTSLDSFLLPNREIPISSFKGVTNNHLTWMNQLTPVSQDYVILQKKKSR